MASKYNIKIERGATFSLVLTWKDETEAPVNLTGYTARMHIREKASSSTTLLELTTENSGIVLGGVLGTIEISIPAATSTAFPWSVGVYDLELVSGSFVKRMLQGNVTVDTEVTR